MKRYLKLANGTKCDVGKETTLTTTNGKILRTGDYVQLWSKHGLTYFPAFVCINKELGDEPHIYDMYSWNDNEKLHDDWIVDFICSYSEIKSGTKVDDCEMVVENEVDKNNIIQSLEGLKNIVYTKVDGEAINVAIELVKLHYKI